MVDWVGIVFFDGLGFWMVEGGLVMVLNCRYGFWCFGYFCDIVLVGMSRVLFEGNVYIEGKSIEGSWDCNMIDFCFGFLEI